jgi:hypothetical protein
MEINMIGFLVFCLFMFAVFSIVAAAVLYNEGFTWDDVFTFRDNIIRLFAMDTCKQKVTVQTVQVEKLSNRDFAELIVDGLVTGNVVPQDQFDRAVDITQEEIGSNGLWVVLDITRGVS